MVCHSQLSEVLFADGPRYIPTQQGLHYLGLLTVALFEGAGQPPYLTATA